MINAYGWTFSYIRNELEWPDLLNLLAFMDDNPPVCEVVEAIGKQIYGLKRDKKGRSSGHINPPLEHMQTVSPGIVITRTKKQKPAA